jgi:hypothetical protein
MPPQSYEKEGKEDFDQPGDGYRGIQARTRPTNSAEKVQFDAIVIEQLRN